MSMQNRPVGYPLSITDAAMLAKVPPIKIREFVCAGLLPCLLFPTGSHSEWFNADDIRAFANMLAGIEDADMAARRVHEVGEALRAYLTALPPLTEYDVALVEGAPVLAKSRSGRVHAHVQPHQISAWTEQHLGRKYPSATLEGTVERTLKELGAVRMRGLTPLTGSGQRWHYWWRLPLTYWSASPELMTLLEGLTAREDGERVTVRSGKAQLVEPMREFGED
jgi:hypothetical protein